MTERANPRNSYDVRSYTLAAGIPQALPSAREFIIVSASDVTSLSVNLGEANGDFQVWPFGFAVGVKSGSTKARILSSNTQTVTVCMLDGDATVKDNRFAPGAGSLPVTEADGANVALGAKADAAATTDIGAFSLIALVKRLLLKSPGVYTSMFSNAQNAGGGSAGATLVAGGANVNGILVMSATIACRNDPGADFWFGDGTGFALRAFDGQCVSIASPFIIPAGSPLSYNMQGGGNFCVVYRVL